MRKLAILLLLVGNAASAFAVKRVTVAQLEQEVAALHGKPDGKMARQLRDLELTERLSDANLAALQAETDGRKARQALRVIADLSGFLDLPPAEVPQKPAPDIPAQRRILRQTIKYVIHTVHQLPNLSASRVTTRFEDIAQEDMPGATTYPYHRLYFAGNSNSLVTFRDGQEVVDAAGKSRKQEPAIDGLTTRGEFGPILFTVLLDVTHSTVKWSHWEQRQGKTLAVFAYSVPLKQSHYQIGAYRQPGDPSRLIPQLAGYHGQIGVDPDSGAVLRIVVQADLKPTDPTSRADVLVEYGPVELGGRPYICPIRSVAILIDNTGLTSSAQGFESPNDNMLTPRRQMRLDEVDFTQYHVFRAESRILP